MLFLRKRRKFRSKRDNEARSRDGNKRIVEFPIFIEPQLILGMNTPAQTWKG